MIAIIFTYPNGAHATNYDTPQTISLQNGDNITIIGTGTAIRALSSLVGTTLTLPGNNRITASGPTAAGLYAATLGSVINATNTRVFTSGTSNSFGAGAIGGGIINLYGAVIETTGSGSHALKIGNDRSNITTDKNTKITASGAGSYALQIYAAAVKQYDNTTPSNALAGEITATGDKGAAFQVTGSGSRLIFQDIDFTSDTKITLGNTAWTGIVSLSGVMQFQGNSNAANSRFQIGTGSLVFTGNAIAKNSLITFVGASSILNLQNYTGTSDFSVAGIDGALGSIRLGNKPLVIDGDTANSFGGVIQGAGGAVRDGQGTLALSGVNTYTGGTTFKSGTLVVSRDQNLGALSGVLNFNGGTLQLTDSFSSARAVTLDTNGGTIQTATGKSNSLSGIISGDGQIIKSGDGILILSNNNSYLGGTMINGGVMPVTVNYNLGAATGALTINGGTLQLTDSFDNSRPVSLGDIGSTIQTTAGKNNGFSGVISGTGKLNKTGDGTLRLSGANSYGGGTVITAGVLQLGDNGASGSVEGEITNNGTLVIKRGDAAASPYDFTNKVTGTGGVLVSGTGTVKFTNEDNAYSGGTELAGGVLQIESDKVLGNAGGLTFSDGTLATETEVGMSRAISFATGKTGTFHTSKDLTLHGTITGDAAAIFNKSGAGRLILGATSDGTGFTGTTNIIEGMMTVKSQLGGQVNVLTGGILGGDGTLTGNVVVKNGGTLTGVHDMVLTINGDLDVQSGSFVHSIIGTVLSDDPHFYIKGNLTLDGVLNIDTSGQSIQGVYRIFQYDGALSGAGLVLGTVTNTANPENWSIQSNIPNQINLIHSDGLGVQYWDGVTTTANQQVDGGTGIWNRRTSNWTNETGTSNGTWFNDNLAIFQGAQGTVTIDTADGVLQSGGLMFLTDGYVITGDDLTLDKVDETIPVVQVGYGDSSSKSWTTTIDTILHGADGLNKTGAGTLILTKDAQYSGVTTVSAGALQLGDGHDSGSINSDVVLSGNHFDDAILIFNRSDAMPFNHAISGAGEVIQRGLGTVTFAGANSFAGGLTVERGTAQAGIADVAFGSGRVAVNTGTTADLNGFDITVAGLLDGKDGGGAVTLGSGTLTLNQGFDSTFSGVISGAGGLIKNGSGVLTISGINTYSGNTKLNGGFLKQGAKDAFSGASAYSVSADGTLALNGFDTSMLSLSNNGLTDFGGNGGATLNVAGNYSGGGTLVFNTVLGDDSSKTDLLKVGGDTSGTTTVQAINRGGLGAQTTEGIKIIDVAGQSNGIFNLVSDFKTKDGQQAVIGGAYAYTLQKNGAANSNGGAWYLRSQLKNPREPSCEDTNTCPSVNPPHYNPGAPIYEGYGQTLQALNKLPTLQQRVGNRYWSHASNPVIEQGADTLDTPLVPSDEAGTAVGGRGIWGRVEGAHNHFEPKASTAGMKQDINTLILQAGLEGRFYEGATGTLIGGVTGQYGKARGDVASDHGDGKIDTQGWGLGGTLTWYGDNGFYADGQAQAMWYDSDLNSSTANHSLSNSNKGFGYGLSLEAGKRVDLNDNWSLTPQAQLTWSTVDFDTFDDAWGATVDSRNGDSLTGRLGISADYRNAWRDANGLVQRTNIYAIANLYQEFMGASEVNVAGVAFANENDKTWAGIGAGGTFAWSDDKYALYGEGALNTSLNRFADSYTVKGTVGFRVKW